MNFSCQADVFQLPHHRQYLFVNSHAAAGAKQGSISLGCCGLTHALMPVSNRSKPNNQRLVQDLSSFFGLFYWQVAGTAANNRFGVMAAGRWSFRPFARCCSIVPAGRYLFGFSFFILSTLSLI